LRVLPALLLASIGLVCGSAWAQVVTEFSAGISAGAAPVAMTTAPDGNLWFTEEGLDRIARITPLGVVTEFSVGISPGAQPRGIARGPDGNLWFAENGGDRIGKIDPTTGVVTEFSAGITPGAKPRSITAGPDGNLWFTEEGLDQIGRITPAGVVTEFAGLTPGAFPFGITAGADGNLWFTENQGNQIGKINPTTFAVNEYPVTPCATPCSGPLFIAGGPDGNLWFTEVSNNQIGRITPAGAVLEFSIPTPDVAPNGITAGSDGNLWFTEAVFSAIGRITTAGVFGEFAVNTANAAPRRITSGLDGNLWFTEFAVDQIGRITTGGNTQLGIDADVDLGGGDSAPGGVSVSFAQVTGAGDTAGTTASSCPAVPAGFSVGTPAFCYDLTTTAVYTPPIEVCVSYRGVSFGAGPIALLHYQAGAWVDVTTTVDTANQIVCGDVNSLSPFVVAETVGAPPAVAPPSIAKAFGAAAIQVFGGTSLTFTISNPNTSALSGIGFSDTLPAGLIVATPNGRVGSCGGAVTATPTSNSIALTGGTLAAGGNCNISVNVIGKTVGVKVNTTGNVTSTEGGSGNTASANLTVQSPAGHRNCAGKLRSALARQYGGIAQAAAALGFATVRDLQQAIRAACSP
jgi:streptogramin lyase